MVGRAFVSLVSMGALALVGLFVSVAHAAPTLPNELSHGLVAPTNCDNCHQFDNPPPREGEPAFAPYDSWAGSLMANAARDPVFWAGVAIASQDSPTDTELCIRCHSPRAFLEGRQDSIAIGELQSADLFSVECEMCHRMVDDGILGNAQYTIDDNQIMGNVPRRGPWTYAGSDPPHSWQQDTYLGASEQCGVCHEVTTPNERVDDFGVGLGVPFNEQRTYSEWLGSDFAVPGPGFASCQDCHMPAVADVAGCASFIGSGEHPSGGRRHDLAGANLFTLELLKAAYGSAGTDEVGDAAYDHAIARTQEMLASAATLEVFAPAVVDLGAGFELDVTVTNQSGHKLPTGYAEGRVMWLEVVAEYDGQLLYSSGHWDAGMIEQDPQLRTYEAIAEQWSTGAAFHLLLNDHWVSDTRIPPAGLVPDPETDPITNRYPLLLDGTWASYDDVTYLFEPTWGLPDATPADPADDQLEITVRLRYLINTPDYVVFLETENLTNTAGLDLAAMVGAAGDAPAMVLAEQTVIVELTGFDAVPPGGSTSGGSESGGGTDSGGGTTFGGGTSTGGFGSTGGETTGGFGSTGGMTTGGGSESGGGSGSGGGGSSSGGAESGGGSSSGGGSESGGSSSGGGSESAGTSTGFESTSGGAGESSSDTGTSGSQGTGDASTGSGATSMGSTGGDEGSTAGSGGGGDEQGGGSSGSSTSPSDGGCSCRSEPRRGAWLLSWPLLLGLRRRQRRRRARRPNLRS